MTVPPTYSDIPTPLPPPPRPVAGGQGCGIWFLRVLFFSHTCVGVGMVLYAFLAFACALFGSNLIGRVTRVETSAHEGHDNYSVYYTYAVHGRTQTGVETISHAVYDDYAARLRDGRPVPVTVRDFGIGYLRFTVLPQYHTAFREGLLLLGMAIGWNAILAVFIYMAWIKPYRYRWLYRHGATVPGVIIELRTRGDDPPAHVVSYAYDVSGQRVTDSIKTNKDRYDAAHVGDVVTVLYDPRRPHRSIVYEFGRCRIPTAVPPSTIPPEVPS